MPLSFNDLIVLLNSECLVEKHFLTQYTSKLTKKEIDTLCANAHQSLADSKPIQASNYAYGGMVLVGMDFFEKLRRGGFFRVSNLSYEANPLVQSVKYLQTMEWGLTDEVREYFGNLMRLYKISESVRKEYTAIKEWLSPDRDSNIKSVLALLDYMFLISFEGIYETSKCDRNSRDPHFFDAHDYAAGFSSLLALFYKEFGPIQRSPAINPETYSTDIVLKVLTASAHLAEFRDWEILIDHFCYTIEELAPDSYKLKSPSWEFTRALRLGYITTDQQRLASWCSSGGSHRDYKNSFRYFAPAIVEKLEKAHLIKQADNPPRIQFFFPEEMLCGQANIRSLLFEEKSELEFACKELFTPADQLLDFEFVDGVDVLDFFLVSRTFQFIRAISAAKLIPCIKNNPQLVLESILHCIPRDNLVRMVDSVHPDRPNGSMVLDLLTVDARKAIDILYRPLIPVGDSLLVPPNIFATSNVYRNPFAVTQKRLYPDGATDPLVDFVCNSFVQSGYEATASFVYDGGEVDVLVLIDDYLLVLECKNSLIPTGVHELRTSYDHVLKAAGQLGRFLDKLETDSTFRKKVADSTKLDIDRVSHVITGIVMSNRMFAGLRIDNHPVRCPYEIAQFLLEGTSNIATESYHYWAGDSCTKEDIRRFFEDDITYIHRWNALELHSSKYQLNDCNVETDHVFLNLPTLAGNYGFDELRDEMLGRQKDFAEMMKNYSFVDAYTERRNNNLREIAKIERANARKKPKKSNRYKGKENNPTQSLMQQDDSSRKRDRIGRNDPCPCRSGKKFKKCCGK